MYCQVKYACNKYSKNPRVPMPKNCYFKNYYMQCNILSFVLYLTNCIRIQFVLFYTTFYKCFRFASMYVCGCEEKYIYLDICVIVNKQFIMDNQQSFPYKCVKNRLHFTKVINGC